MSTTNHSEFDKAEYFLNKRGLVFAAIRQEFGDYDRAAELAELNNMEFNDLVQVAQLTFWRLLLNYDESRQETFVGYAVESMRWRMRTELYVRGKPIKTPLSCSPDTRRGLSFCSINKTIKYGNKETNIKSDYLAVSPDDVEKMVIDRITLEEKLTEQELQIFKWRDQGYSDPEISKFIGITTQSVNRIRNRAIKRINPDYIPTGKNKVYMLKTERNKRKRSSRGEENHGETEGRTG